MKKVCFNCGHEFDYTSKDIQDNYLGRYLVCPKCGHNNYSFKEKEDGQISDS